jgi:outer membrane protein
VRPRFAPWGILLLLALPARAQAPAGKIAVFDSSIVFDRSQHGQQLKGEIERLRDLRLKEMGDKQDELNQLQQEMRAKELTFNDEKRAEMSQRINQKQIELQRMNDDATREVQAEFNKAQQKLQKELIQVVEAVGRDGGYTMIVEKGFAVYASPDIDVTGVVLDKFNEMFPTSSESTPPTPSDAKPPASPDAKPPAASGTKPPAPPDTKPPATSGAKPPASPDAKRPAPRS